MSVNVLRSSASFAVIDTAEELQTAIMRLEPGEASGSKRNEHPHSEQVLYVVEGSIEAEIGDKRFAMHSGDSVIVPKEVAHRFSNTTQKIAVTFNVYAPPAY